MAGGPLLQQCGEDPVAREPRAPLQQHGGLHVKRDGAKLLQKPPSVAATGPWRDSSTPGRPQRPRADANSTTGPDVAREHARSPSRPKVSVRVRTPGRPRHDADRASATHWCGRDQVRQSATGQVSPLLRDAHAGGPPTRRIVSSPPRSQPPSTSVGRCAPRCRRVAPTATARPTPSVRCTPLQDPDAPGSRA
jgi:hypothetical protein